MATSSIGITTEGGRIVLNAPAHPRLHGFARKLGGRWDGRAWSFASKHEDAVRDLARDLFGTDGDGAGRDAVRVRVDLGFYGEGTIGGEGEAWFAGRLVARRPSRDAEVELGDGVKLVAGGFPHFGGAKNHPSLDTRFGTVIEVDAVPRRAAEQAQSDYPLAVSIIGAPRKAPQKTESGSSSSRGEAAAAPKASAPQRKAAPKARQQAGAATARRKASPKATARRKVGGAGGRARRGAAAARPAPGGGRQRARPAAPARRSKRAATTSRGASRPVARGGAQGRKRR